MRLTLRTMLAHMDGILEPEDDDDIRKKIADSEYATNLMHRIRDAMRRLRLGSPGLGPRAPGLDPNTVAEYLDNALPDDHVADFEKVCLESDMQLAEVAAAHQVLTLVLGEPVEIDPAARQRMYRLPQVAVEAEQAAEVRRREKPGVPDYLREPARSRVGARAMAMLAIAAVVVLAVLAATGGLNPWLERAGLRSAAPDVAGLPGTPVEPADPGESAVTTPDEGVLREETAEPETAEVSEPPAVSPTEPPAVPVPPLQPAPLQPAVEDEPGEPGVELVLPRAPLPDDVAVPAPLPTDPLEPDPLPGDILPPAPLPDDVPGVAPEPMPLPGVEAPGDPEFDAAPERLPGEAAVERPRDPAPVPESLLPGLRDPVAPEGPAPPPERTDGPPLGRLVSDRQLLLQFDPAQGSWDRVAMQTEIRPERPLLAPPTYRPVIALTAGFTVQIVGPAQTELHPANADGLPMLVVDYGRLMMHTLGQPGTQIRLAVGERTGTITFTQAESGVAMHVERLAKPGDDPESRTAPLLASLWTTRGSIVWQTDGGQPVVVGTRAAIALGTAGPEPPEPKSAAPPVWVTEDQSSFLDMRASGVLVEEVPADRPAALALREAATGHRQREVRWLAVRSLGYLGQFDPMVAVLDEEDSKTVWFEYIDELRAAMARDPRLAVAVRESLRKHYGADAEKLYRMLWGYSSDELADGAAAVLVNDLEHERLAVRLLSFWNLREITGLGLFYRPELSAAKRQLPVQRWRERLASGDITRKAEQRGPED